MSSQAPTTDRPTVCDTVNAYAAAARGIAVSDDPSLEQLRVNVAKIVEGHEDVSSVRTTARGYNGACEMHVFDFDNQQTALVVIDKHGTVEALPIPAPVPSVAGRSLTEWDSYIGAGRTLTDATDRMQEAVNAGVKLGDLLALQTMRHRQPHKF